MIASIALIGQANVGKSTIFNRLTKTREALVLDQPGVTRDRLYGYADTEQSSYVLIDTGGLHFVEDNFDQALLKQAEFAIEEADLIFFVVDARLGLTPNDLAISEQLRRAKKPVYLIVNKADGEAQEAAGNEFYQLGFSDLFLISAKHHRGVNQLLASIDEFILANNFQQSLSVDDKDDDAIRVVILGRPNVGKSTLSNRILGEDRLLVSDQAGTTRDKIAIDIEHREQAYRFYDTAGVRRRAKIHELVEKYSILQSLQALNEAHVAILLLNGEEGIVEQDLHLLHHILTAGKALIIVVNKWDHLGEDLKQQMHKDLERRLGFVTYAEQHFISAKHGSGVGKLFPAINRAYQSAMKTVETPVVNQLLQQAQQDNPPPRVRGRVPKLRYAHAGGKNPPIIVVHGRRVNGLPEHYRRYLMNYFRKALKIVGNPIKILFKDE